VLTTAACRRLGLSLGAISCAFYLKSRVSQILKNLARNNAEGLSTSMFLCAIAGNLTGFAGIVLRLDSWRSAAWQLPWMLGMFGTVAMDVVIAHQTLAGCRRAREGGGAEGPAVSGSEECRLPLLEGEGRAVSRQ